MDKDKNQERGDQNQESRIQNPWKTLSTKDIYSNKWIAVSEHQVINPAGGQGIYGKVHFNNKAIGIIPIDDLGNTWLVGQYRYTMNEYTWEIPEGGGPVGTSPLESARRELREETGITAENWQLILRIHTSNSVTDEEGFVFLAEGLTLGESSLEETEADLIVKKLPFKEALEMVLTGKITDAMSVAGILYVARLKKIYKL